MNKIKMNNSNSWKVVKQKVIKTRGEIAKRMNGSNSLQNKFNQRQQKKPKSKHNQSLLSQLKKMQLHQ